MKLNKLTLAVAVLTATGHVCAGDNLADQNIRYTTLPTLVVEGQLQTADEQRLTLDEAGQGVPADAADLLRQVNGVEAIRMGGRGLDPIIRGQSQTQLNVLMDGAYIHGGCPNRMDPPTTYSSLESYDRITVIKGAASVLYGAGGSGGTILFERSAPDFAEGENLKGHAVSGYKTNSETTELSADLAAGTGQGYLRVIGGYQDAGNYDDGDGNETRSAFTSKSGNLMLGLTPDEFQRFEVNLETNREDDTLYAGAGMDSPESEADTTRLLYEYADPVSRVSAVTARFYKSSVDHLMDNYSLRELTAPMKMAAPSTSDTTGGRISTDLRNGEQLLTLGLDYQRNERNAERLSGPADGGDPAMLQSVMWPGAELEQSGVFGQWQTTGNADRLWKAGVRLDRIHASASRADEQPAVAMTPTPSMLYTRYYGTADTDAEETNLGGFAQVEQRAGNGSLYAILSRSVRTADANERYIASFSRNMMTGVDSSWVGNPELNPEQHHQLELGYRYAVDDLSASLSVYQSRVTDYILRDLARGQEGVLMDNGTATVYRNVDVIIRGAEAGVGYQLTDHLNTALDVSWVHKDNVTDHRVVAQTPPLSATLRMDYRGDRWESGTLITMNADQNRADLYPGEDLGSGQDVQETAGWAVMSLYGRYRITRYAQAELGVDNLFDRTYAYHVNRANADPFNPQAVLVNEPGRVIWGRLSVSF
ncbi:MAG TPA: TonB-dependent copper receptor [Oceanospirillales bacterium]|nr:TonB-dependent copper receptor [Oceanospirillales bacterium]